MVNAVDAGLKLYVKSAFGPVNCKITEDAKECTQKNVQRFPPIVWCHFFQPSGTGSPWAFLVESVLSWQRILDSLVQRLNLNLTLILISACDWWRNRHCCAKSRILRNWRRRKQVTIA